MFYAAALVLVASTTASGVALTFDQTAAIVISAMLVGLGTWSLKKKRGARTNAEAVMAECLSGVRDIKVSLLGAPITEFNQTPEPGLIAVVKDLVPIVADHSEMLKELVADKKPNSGKTTRDAIDRIEENLGTSPTIADKQGRAH